MKNYAMYVLDTETTSLDHTVGDVIELSISRMGYDEIKTWHIKPSNPDGIDPGALRVNGHKLEDLLWKTEEGKVKYRLASEVIVEVENFLLDDGLPTLNRILVAHNAGFDKTYLEQLWKKAGSAETFPFGRRIIDTSSIEFFLDLCTDEDNMAQGYSLSNLGKKYGIKNDKAHTAEADTKTLKAIFEKQIESFKKALKK